MQQDNNIENKLRQMEALDEPDCSQLDNHWQQMAAMLQPPVLPVKKGWPKWKLNGLYVVAAAVLTGVAVWLVSQNNNTEPKPAIEQDKVAMNSVQKEMVTNTPVNIADSAGDENPATVAHGLSINPSLIYNKTGNEDYIQWTAQDSILGTIKLNVADCLTCPSSPGIPVMSTAERQLKLQNLFAALEKEEQHFTIDNSRDTLLQFKEGTALLIPANSFGGMNGVELSAKEFYKESDIVLNQLSTASNKEQLETGGMIYLKAGYKGNEVKIDQQKPLILLLQDTSKNMAGMQLFTGDTISNTNTINWKPQQQFFSATRLVTQARVVNLVNEPYKIRDTKKGGIGYFISGDDDLIDKDKVRQKLKEKYGYYKVKLRPNFHRVFHNTYYNGLSGYSRQIGDTVWMDISIVNSYGLDVLSTRQFYVNDNGFSNYYDLSENSRTLFKKVLGKYSVRLSSTGWINCDRFYSYPGKKIDFPVNLGDSAHNYYCVLLFDNIRSIMNGHLSGNHIVFSNIPENLPVKVICIGINKDGETVYSVTHTTTSENELRGLQFQATSVPDLKASLSKLDK